jgi:hypothetical protein
MTSHSFSAQTLVGSRLYVGYGSMPPAPDPNSNQYYGWVEFSRNNVDRVLTLGNNVMAVSHCKDGKIAPASEIPLP